MLRSRINKAAALCLAPFLLYAQPAAVKGPHRMEIALEREQGKEWRSVDPGKVFEQNDRVRFRFHTNFDGYLYVTSRGTSGAYSLLFPREDTGRDNRIRAGKEYMVPATQAWFRIAGPAGHEVVYWLVSPVELPGYMSPPPAKKAPATLLPRCDETLLRARGECIDSTAGARGLAAQEPVPDHLPPANKSADLVFLRQQNKSVVSSAVPLEGPVIYEFRIAHN